MVRPVCWSDLALKENLLRGVEGRPVKECPCVILGIAEGRWHLEVAGIR